MAKNKYMGDGDILRCVAKHLIYRSPYYKPAILCAGCDKIAICSGILEALEGKKDGKKR